MDGIPRVEIKEDSVDPPTHVSDSGDEFSRAETPPKIQVIPSGTDNKQSTQKSKQFSSERREDEYS